ncbi:MAG: 50S ribosomal protein L19 [Spirochaetota bacterium]
MNLVEKLGVELAPEERNVNCEIGDTVRVHYKIIEGNRERVQVYEGTVIATNNKGVGKTITVRRISFDVGVERIFPIYSPRIAKIEVVRKAKIRRSKLYYLRERRGKSAKLRERRISKK